MRYLLCLLIVSVGCVATLPGDDGVTADLAAETARMVVRMRKEIPPAPAPKPTPDAKCKNCLGTGKIGDGRIVLPCPVCKGTGKACQDGTCSK